MKRKFLEDLELDKEIIDKIMAENGKDIEAAKGELSDITAERDSLKKDIEARDQQIETLKKSTGDNEDLKKQIEQLQAENKATKLNGAIEKALTAAKALNITAAKALLKDLDKAELLEDGTVKGLDDQIKALQKDEATKFMFAAPEKPQKLKGMNPADGSDGKPNGITQKDFAKVDATLVGRPGDTITVPKEAYIGDAEDVAEGVAMGTTVLTASTTSATGTEGLLAAAPKRRWSKEQREAFRYVECI